MQKISALQISSFSVLNSSAHTPRYRRFACILTNADARLAVEVVVNLLPPVGLSPTTLHQLAWRTCIDCFSQRCIVLDWLIFSCLLSSLLKSRSSVLSRLNKLLRSLISWASGW